MAMREDGHILVIGATGFDIKGRSNADLQPATSNPGHIRNSYGGVGRNIAENLARLEVPTVLLSVVGDDTAGDLLMAQAAAAGVDVTHMLQVAGGRSGSYIAILDSNGDLSVAVSDYEIMGELSPLVLDTKSTLFEQARMVIMDLNLLPAAIEKIIELCQAHHVPLCVDPTSPAHTPKISPFIRHLFLVAPNTAEATELCGLEIITDDPDSAVNAAKFLVNAGAEIAIITLGEHGVAYASRSESGHIEARKTQLVDTTGAGDALFAGVIYGLLNNLSLDEAMRLGVTAASLTLHSRDSVVPDLNPDLLYEHLIL